jgi:hypothetical protein
MEIVYREKWSKNGDCQWRKVKYAWRMSIVKRKVKIVVICREKTAAAAAEEEEVAVVEEEEEERLSSRLKIRAN